MLKTTYTEKRSVHTNLESALYTEQIKLGFNNFLLIDATDRLVAIKSDYFSPSAYTPFNFSQKPPLKSNYLKTIPA